MQTHDILCPNCGTHLPDGTAEVSFRYTSFYLCPSCRRYFHLRAPDQSEAGWRENMRAGLSLAWDDLQKRQKDLEQKLVPYKQEAADIEANARVFRESRLEEVCDQMQPLEEQLRDLKEQSRRVRTQLDEMQC